MRITGGRWVVIGGDKTVDSPAKSFMSSMKFVNFGSEHDVYMMYASIRHANRTTPQPLSIICDTYAVTIATITRGILNDAMVIYQRYIYHFGMLCN